MSGRDTVVAVHPASAPVTIGPYRVVRELGTGGWSTVYEVIGPDGATLALKRLRADLPPAALARFRREAESLRRIDHPGVLRLIDFGSDRDGAPYLVTPRVDGASLRELLASGALGIEGALLVVLAAAEALGAIHAAGLVHRDFKPENLMIGANGEVVVIDLGLALGPEHSRYTEENALTGSVPYMAPEQIEDRSPTAASDVWALAVVLYETALGRRPFQRERQSEEVAAILAGKHESLAARDPRCADELSQVVERCLDPSPERRPSDGAALARELAACVDWLAPGELAAARQALARDPAGYAASVAPIRASRLSAAARAALDRGDAFAASRHVDRALALTPDDRQLHALLEEVMSGGPLAGETVPGRAPDPDPSGTLVGFSPPQPSAGHRVVVSAERPSPSSGPSSGSSPPSRRAMWIVGAIALAAIALVAVVAIATLDHRSGAAQPDASPPRDHAVRPDDPEDGAVEKPSHVRPSQPATPAETDDDLASPAVVSPPGGVIEKPSHVKPSRPAAGYGSPGDGVAEKPPAL